LFDRANKAMQARNYSTANDLLDMAASTGVSMPWRTPVWMIPA
jgi:hypothetical protein